MDVGNTRGAASRIAEGRPGGGAARTPFRRVKTDRSP